MDEVEVEVDVERLNQRRRWLLVAFAAAYLLWQGPEIASRLVQPTGTLFGVLRGLSVVGALSWVAVSVWLYCFGKRMAAHPNAAMALNDGRIAAMRLRSFAAGFVSLIGYLVLLRLSKMLFVMPVELAAELGLLLGVMVSVGAFVVYEHRDP